MMGLPKLYDYKNIKTFLGSIRHLCEKGLVVLGWEGGGHSNIVWLITKRNIANGY